MINEVAKKSIDIYLQHLRAKLNAAEIVRNDILAAFSDVEIVRNQANETYNSQVKIYKQEFKSKLHELAMKMTSNSTTIV